MSISFDSTSHMLTSPIILVSSLSSLFLDMHVLRVFCRRLAKNANIKRLLFALLQLLARQLLANLRSCNMIGKGPIAGSCQALILTMLMTSKTRPQDPQVLTTFRETLPQVVASSMHLEKWSCEQQETAVYPTPSENGFVCTEALPFQDSPKSSQKLWEVPQTEKQTSWPQCYCRLARHQKGSFFTIAQTLLEISSNLF